MADTSGTAPGLPVAPELTLADVDEASKNDDKDCSPEKGAESAPAPSRAPVRTSNARSRMTKEQSLKFWAICLEMEKNQAMPWQFDKHAHCQKTAAWANLQRKTDEHGLNLTGKSLESKLTAKLGEYNRKLQLLSAEQVKDTIQGNFSHVIQLLKKDDETGSEVEISTAEQMIIKLYARKKQWKFDKTVIKERDAASVAKDLEAAESVRSAAVGEGGTEGILEEGTTVVSGDDDDPDWRQNRDLDDNERRPHSAPPSAKRARQAAGGNPNKGKGGPGEVLQELRVGAESLADAFKASAKADSATFETTELARINADKEVGLAKARAEEATARAREVEANAALEATKRSAEADERRDQTTRMMLERMLAALEKK